jgi:hypothetical protein
MNILVKYASRSRPENFERGLKSIIFYYDDYISNVYVLVSLDSDDPKLKEYEEIISKYNETYKINAFIGESKNKVDAINRNIFNIEYEWDVLVNMSDDMVLVEDWDSIIAANIEPCKFLHFNDGNHNEYLCTMSVMHRDYYNLDGYIYNPAYKSLYCDQEATEVAHIRGLRKYVPVQICKHLHPEWGYSPLDQLYVANNKYANEDLTTIRSRRITMYGIENRVNSYLYKSI